MRSCNSVNMQKILGFTVFSGQAKTVCNLLDAVPQRLPRTSLLSSLRIRAARWRECVYVLQSVFLLLLSFFSVRHAKCINMRQPFSGTAERLFMKLLPNDRGENGLSPWLSWLTPQCTLPVLAARQH